MKAKKIIALILSFALVFSLVPTFGMFAGAEDTVVQEDEEDFVPEYEGENLVKADNYFVNLARAFSNLASSVLYSTIGVFWTALFPMVSIPIFTVGSSTVAVAAAKFGKAFLGYKV